MFVKKLLEAVKRLQLCVLLQVQAINHTNKFVINKASNGFSMIFLLLLIVYSFVLSLAGAGQSCLVCEAASYCKQGLM